jgi:hypothetical protein
MTEATSNARQKIDRIMFHGGGPGVKMNTGYIVCVRGNHKINNHVRD